MQILTLYSRCGEGHSGAYVVLTCMYIQNVCVCLFKILIQSVCVFGGGVVFNDDNIFVCSHDQFCLM